MAEIKEIKALPKIEKKLRVAGYCRVSSGKDEQLHSLSVQVGYFKERIVHHPGWEFAGVYYLYWKPDFEKNVPRGSYQ